MLAPKVSVIVPVYNTKDYLSASLDCIANQSLQDIEVICVDDSSTDGSYDILKEYEAKDPRFKVLRQENAGAGAARNRGFAIASGEYAYFFDADDLCSEKLLELSYDKAEATKADIVAFDFFRFHDLDKKERACGVHTDWLKETKEVFNYKDMPDRILSSVYVAPWNKLYRSDFIREHGLRFEEISSSNDVTFSVVSVAMADRIAAIREPLISHRIGHAGTITSGKKKTINDVWTAITSAVRQIEPLPYYDEIRDSMWRFEIDHLYVVFRDFMDDLKEEQAAALYKKLHAYFNSPHFDDLVNENVGNPKYYQSFEIIRSHDYDEMVGMKGRRIVVSMTTYPARIDGIYTVLQSIYSQTKKADEVVLYLAESQFPNGTVELPKALQELEQGGKLQIRYVAEDLKPHKKYLYALAEYPEDLIVTVDDDLLYPADMLQCLYESYLQYPKAVSAMRTHLITFDGDNKLTSYNDWIRETDGCIYRPSMQLLCTGGAGALYPPHIFDQTICEKSVIALTCPDADDLWLKANELVCDIPVVLAKKIDPLKKLPDSQESALWYSNVMECRNDEQWAKISRFMDGQYGEGILQKKLTDPSIGVCIMGTEALYRHMREGSRYMKNKSITLQSRLDSTYAQKAEINTKLQQTYKEKSEINAKLQQTYKEKSEINAKLQQTYKEKSEINAEKKKAEARIAELEKELEKVQRELAKFKEHPMENAAKTILHKIKK